jgi:hypothetical protein
MYLFAARSPSNLGFYRPNQAIERGHYTGRRLQGLGQTSVSLSPLLVGIGVLAAGFFLLGSRTGPVLRRRRRARLERKLARLREA